MKRYLRYLLVILLLSTFQAYAGVVEDAEEELKKMGRGQEQRINAESDRSAPSYPTRRVNRSRPRGSKTSGTDQAAKTGSEGAAKTPGSNAPAALAEDAVEESGRAKLDKMEKRQGRLMSLGIVLLLAILIFVATVAGKRLGKSE
jgi:cobalamin biosynthesis Mg chelatase CobN